MDLMDKGKEFHKLGTKDEYKYWVPAKGLTNLITTMGDAVRQ